MKKIISGFIDSISNELINSARKIWKFKETGLKEFKSADLLKQIISGYGFEITDKIAGLDTAFEASCNKGKGRYKIAFLAEYDALPYIGHGCGHNLIGPASLGAAAGLAQVAVDQDIEVYLFGTPAEETIGGKIIMLEAGCFDNMDMIMMFHPSTVNSVSGDSLAISSFNVEFRGKTAHASADPFNGINALDGLITLYNSLAMLRQQIRSDARIHFIIKEGGYALNIIPDKAVGEIGLRATDRKYLEYMTDKLYKMVRASASSTFTRSKIYMNMPTYFEMIQNPVLAETFTETAKEFSINDFSYRVEAGSVDIGNISHKIPSLHAYLKILDKDTPGHSREFARASVSEKAFNVMVLASKIMAITGLKVVKSKELFQKLKK